MRFKLVQYNIWHGTHLDQVVDFLRAENPEIACLQEVATNGQGLRTSPVNIFAVLKEQLPYTQAFYSPFMTYDDGVETYDMGQATLSRLEARMIEEYAYKSGKPVVTDWRIVEDVPRLVQVVGVNIGGHEIAVANAHFVWSSETRVTEFQLAAARNLKHYLGRYDEYILTGDMNTLFGSEVYDILAEGLVDVSRGDQPTLHSTIHPAGNMNYHVDYVFYKSERMRHLSTQIPFIDASDHLPLVVEFDYA